MTIDDKSLPSPLAAISLYRHCDLSLLPFSNTSDLEHLDNYFGQDRAIEALKFGLSIEHQGYNIFVLGPSGIGKHQMVTEFIQKYSDQFPNPSDWCYINNFNSPDQPIVMELPNGMACQLQKDMTQCIEDLLVTIPSVFQSTEYKTRVSELSDEYSEKEQQSFHKLAEKAKQKNIALLQTPTGYTLAPQVDGKILTTKEFKALPEKEQKQIQEAINQLKEELKSIITKMPVWVKEGREQFKKLNQEIVRHAVNQIFNALEEKYTKFSEIISFLSAVKQDVIENIDNFKLEDNAVVPDNLTAEVQAFPMYMVNVLVDNSKTTGAPVVYEDNPSLVNLLGRVEHESQFGTLTTNFTLIKPGSLHKANHGYLILDANKVLTNPFAWEALKRALQSRKLSIESIDQMLSLVSTKSLEPEPVPLDVKIILLGDRLIYYLLQAYDPDFNLLFKVPADITEEIDITDDNLLCYARLIAALQHKNGVRPLDQGAVSKVIEQGSRLIEDTQKLPLHLMGLTDLLYESDHFAKASDANIISREHVQQAIDAEEKRLDQFKQRVHESILREIQLIETDDEKIAQINGLSVYQIGESSFGRPTKITAQARLGHGKVLDIEREVKLGGNLHSKAVMILASFMANRYARNRPLPISASLVFEQSYGGIEGDSASIAELCVLISAISGIPIKQSLAVTGSINQHGVVQAIGGVNQKIEGFFDICNARTLTGIQGVIIPQSNVQHLMLAKRVVDAVESGLFNIYAVTNVDEALSLLTGIPIGTMNQQGKYPDDSINGRVSLQIEEWIQLNKTFSSPPNHDHADDQ